MNAARVALAEAKSKRADLYAVESFKQAECAYDSAMACWKKENRKPFYQRKHFFRTRMHATTCLKCSQKAAKFAANQSVFLETDLKRKIEANKLEISKYDKTFSRIPFSSLTRKENNRGILLLKEAELAYEKKNYNLCNEKLTQATYLLEKTYKYFLQYLNEYFRNYGSWKQQADAAIAFSRRGRTYSLVVDKFDRKCFVYYSGALKHTFDIDLGLNWIGDKNERGDKKTPEGRYRITSKKDSRNTCYYKALLIDYPNQEDIARNRAGRRNVSRLGNLIEIHGGGGKRADWTDGCVALANRDMDVLFRCVSSGTPVTIVGSLKPLTEIINN